MIWVVLPSVIRTCNISSWKPGIILFLIAKYRSKKPVYLWENSQTIKWMITIRSIKPNKCFHAIKIKVWPSPLPDLNIMENLSRILKTWVILKQSVNRGGITFGVILCSNHTWNYFRYQTASISNNLYAIKYCTLFIYPKMPAHYLLQHLSKYYV